MPTAHATLARRRFLGALSVTAVASALLPPRTYGNAKPEKRPRALKGRQAGFYRFRIGDFEAVALLDGVMKVPSERFSSMYCGRPQEIIVSDLQAALERDDIVELHFNSLLVNTGKDLVLVDTGAGALYKENGGWLPGNLAAAGVAPEEISAVFVTHGDFDHFGGLIDPATSRPVYKNARHFISRLEYAYVTNTPDPQLAALPPKLKPGGEKNGLKYLKALEGRWEFVAEGDKPLPGIEVVDLRGHKPGHLGFLFESAGQKLLHFGDVFHHYVLSVAHPDWTFLSDQIPPQAIEARAKVLRLADNGKLRLFGSHMPFPGLGRIRNTPAGRPEFVREAWSAV